ncbi:hypothetical protein [Bradyrhizobium sp.]|jgi:hypothetical protein
MASLLQCLFERTIARGLTEREYRERLQRQQQRNILRKAPNVQE